MVRREFDYVTKQDVQIELSPIDTKNLRFKTYVYDIQWIKLDDSVVTIVPPSKFTILEEVTYE